MASRIKLSPRAIQNRINGRKGGLATAALHGEEFCRQRAQNAGLACKAKYGKDFYLHIKKYKKSRKREPIPTQAELAQRMTQLAEVRYEPNNASGAAESKVSSDRS